LKARACIRASCAPSTNRRSAKSLQALRKPLLNH
jgi:hypothetical protein